MISQSTLAEEIQMFWCS